MSSVTQAPKYQLFREAVAAIDASVPTNKNEGMNFAGYDIGFIQVIASGGAIPEIEIMSWSENAGTFISVNPAASFTAAGANESFECSFSPYGRIAWVRVVDLGGAGEVNILASGRRLGNVS